LADFKFWQSLAISAILAILAIHEHSAVTAFPPCFKVFAFQFWQSLAILAVLAIF
jgi:hypothetical protein